MKVFTVVECVSNYDSDWPALLILDGIEHFIHERFK